MERRGADSKAECDTGSQAMERREERGMTLSTQVRHTYETHKLKQYLVHDCNKMRCVDITNLFGLYDPRV